MYVKVIPADRSLVKTDSEMSEDLDSSKMHGKDKTLTHQKLRVAAYCRVSTDLEDQESSYEAQVDHYYYYIKCHKEWEYAGIYADEGISGTGTAKREGFNQMISDCKKGEIDLILTKSISRFARNTLDCLRYIRLLKERKIGIVFEKEGINTLDTQGEVLITILASIAQQESRSISENVRMGIHYQFQKGKVRINHTHFLGYTKDALGQLIIVDEEAEIVRRIFMEFLCGISMSGIARGLTADKIPTSTGNTKWYTSTIKSILQNEKYMGDAILQKYYTKDFLSKKQMVNDGRYPRYYIENDHDPIISREIFEQAQKLIDERTRNLKRDKSRYNYYYALSGKLICSQCGSCYYRINKNGNNHHTTWRCKKRIHVGQSCEGPILKETDLHIAILKAFKVIMDNKDYYVRRLDRLTNSIIPELKAERSETMGLLEQLYEKQVLDANPDKELNREIEQAMVRKDGIDKASNAVMDERVKISRILSYMDYYQSCFQRDEEAENMEGEEQTEQMDYANDGEDNHVNLYNEELMRQILEEVIVYESHLEIRFCVGEKQVVTI